MEIKSISHVNGKKKKLRIIYLTDDDNDDRELFIEAIKDLDSSFVVIQSQNSIQLMDNRSALSDNMPEVLFQHNFFLLSDLELLRF